MDLEVIRELFGVIEDRRDNPKPRILCEQDHGRRLKEDSEEDQ